jgi:His-Xaa-Ser system protein HxsD
MIAFITKNHENNRLELLVDGAIFPVAIAMKAAYTFLDRCYFFFKKDGENTVVQIHPKENQRWSGETFAMEYSDELIATLLRDTLEKENKTIRETIVKRALSSYLDEENFVWGELWSGNPQIDFDKDIDEILKEIENDPDLQIDEEEINKILAEVEAETKKTQMTGKTLDPNKVKDAKKNFQNR